jgi:hypothetical protein
MQAMTQQEHEDTEEWFIQTSLELTEVDLQIDSGLDAVAQQDKNDWLKAKGHVVGTLSMVHAAEEDFFVRQTLTIRPPTQSVIDETIRRCEALAEEIAKAQKAKSVVKLADNLFKFVSQVLA